VLNNIEGVELAKSSGAFLESLMARAFSNIRGSATSIVGDGIQVSLSISDFKGSRNK
jgi:hypothetical protein